jgi:hypothetical protein
MSSKLILSRLRENEFDSSASSDGVETSSGASSSATSTQASPPDVAGGGNSSKGSILASMLKTTKMKFTGSDNSSVASNLTDDEYGGNQSLTGGAVNVRAVSPGSDMNNRQNTTTKTHTTMGITNILPAVPETSLSNEISSTYIADRQNPKEVDELLRLEHLQLSDEEQQDRDDEVHGHLSRAVQETPALLVESLQQMQRAVQSLPPSDRKTYDRIVAISRQQRTNVPDHQQLASSLGSAVVGSGSNQYAYALENQDLWLKFLRAERFDIRKAAIRYSKYLDILHKYFGDVALMRPLYLSDLNKNDQRLLKQGRFQVLFGARDRSGRRVFTMCEPMGKGFDVSCRVR